MDRNCTGFYNERRRLLIRQIQRVEKMCSKLRNAKVKELSGNEPGADLFAVYEKLGKSEKDCKDYPFFYLATYVETMLICPLLRVALGGKGTLAALEQTCKLLEWIDSFEKRMQPEVHPFIGITGRLIKATRASLDEWRAFAVETEESADPRSILLVEPCLFRRWLIDTEIRPRG